jgi:CRISPR-associated protein Csm3
MKTLKKKILISGQLELVTGLHIGGSKENVSIGDVDNPVIRRTINQQPYIPGSSLKGKMRSLLQVADGEETESQTGSIICRLYGASDGRGEGMEGNPSRVIVRDAYLDDVSEQMLRESENTEMPYTELKHENRIDRIKGKAEHPRQSERVPAGASFNVEMVLNIFEGDNEAELIQTVKRSLKMLEDDYLGGSGTRGYGQVKVKINWDDVKQRDKAYYLAI